MHTNPMPFDTILIFTRYPRPGRVKSRLIPALGAEGATDLQRAMAGQVAGRAWALGTADPNLRVKVLAEDATPAEMRVWLGPLASSPQGEGDLGERMARATEAEFARGARKVLVIGTDCPRMDERTLLAARAALDRTPLVFVPAEDGGYVLVGMTRPCPAIFDGIAWGGPEVLAASLGQATAAGCSYILLPALPDVDTPDDLPDAHAALDEGRRVSVIIPALNEAVCLTRLLPRLTEARPHEVLVADGGSRDGTREVARMHGARVVESPRGRGVQMNRAARLATGEFLLFLHADTEPPARCCALVADHLARPGVAAGAFRFALRDRIAGGALIERMVRFRNAAFRLPYGDQGLFMRRFVFESLGGYPEWPILEDVHLIRQLRRRGRVVIAPEAAATSGRRWRDEGVFRTCLRHQTILLGHRLGISPVRLARLRPPSGPDRPPPRTHGKEPELAQRLADAKVGLEDT